MTRGAPRKWLKLLRSHIGNPIVFDQVWLWNAPESEPTDLGLCFLLSVSGKHYDIRNQYKDCYTSQSVSSHDLVAVVLSCQGVVQVRASYLTTKLLSQDGDLVWSM